MPISYISNGSTNIEQAPVSSQGAYIRNMPNANQIANASTIDVSRYNKYLGTMPSITTNYDHNEIMARTQNGWDMAGNAAVQTLATLTGEVLTMAGAVLQLNKATYSSIGGLVTGDDKSFGESFSEGIGATIMNAGIDFQNYIRDEFKIYQTNEAQDTLALTDASWWASNVPSIASVAASMLVPGGVVKGLTSVGNLAIKGGAKLVATTATSSAIKGASKVLGNTLKSLGKGLTTNFAEKAAYTALASHSDIFVEVAHGFNDKIKEYEAMGLTKEDATIRASEWAADSYRTGVTVGLAFERLEAGLILGKGKRWARIDDGMDTKLKEYIDGRVKGELNDITSNATVKSLSNLEKSNIFKSRGFDHLLNLVNEGFEEMRVDFVMANADQSVRIKNNMPLVDLDTDIMSRIGNFLTEGKNYTSFVFGALGAGVTKLITDSTNPNNNKTATLEYIQNSLNTVQDIDNIITTQFKDEYEPVNPVDPNSIRLKDNRAFAPIHDIAQAILKGSTEIGSASNRYLGMLNTLTDAELAAYFEIDGIQAKEARSFINATIKELNTVEAIRQETARKYNNNVEIKNKEYKIYYETALRYSNDYYTRQLNSIKDEIANTMAVDPAYQKHASDLTTLTSSQRAISDQLIKFEIAERDVQQQIEYAIQDVNKATIGVPNDDTIKDLNNTIHYTDSKQSELQNKVAAGTARRDDIGAELDVLYKSLKNKDISDVEKSDINNAIKELISENTALTDIIANNKFDLSQASKELEDLIRIKNNYESNKQLYADYKTLIAKTEEEIDTRRKLAFDNIVARAAKIKANKEAYLAKHRDETGSLSLDATEALSTIDSFKKAYVRSSANLKAVKALSENTIAENTLQLEDVANGTLDQYIEDIKPKVRDIVNITSLKKLTKVVANVNNLSELKTLSDQVKNSNYYKEAESTEQSKIDKELSNKEKEIREIEQSRTRVIDNNITVQTDGSDKIIEVTRNYRYARKKASVVPISFTIGSSVVLPNGDTIEIESFEQIGDKVYIVDSNNNQYDVVKVFKLSNITNIVQLKMLIDSIDESATEDDIVDLILAVINTNDVITDMIDSLDVDNIDIVKELLNTLEPLAKIEATDVSRLPYNRLSKLYDILIAKQKLTAYNAQYNSLFEADYINTVYDKILKAIYLSEHNVSDVVLSMGDRTIVPMEHTSILKDLNQSDINVVQTINNTAISTANTKVVNDIENKLGEYKNTINDLFREYKISSTIHIKLTSMIARINNNEYTDEDRTYLADLLALDQKAEVKDIYSNLFTLYVVNSEGSNHMPDMTIESAEQLNSFIANGCSELNSRPGDDILKYFTENIQQAIASLKQIYTHILSYEIEGKVTPYNIIKYYISSGLDQQQALKAYSNVKLMAIHIDIVNKYIQSDKDSIENDLSNGFKNMIADIEYMASKTSAAIESKSDKDIERIYNDIKYEDFKFNNNGVRIETPVFDELQSIDLENIDLNEPVDVVFVDGKNKKLDRTLTMYDLITIQNNIQKGVNLYVRKNGINGYATYYKYQGGYVLIEKVNYASDNLIVNTPKGIKTVYSTDSFKQAIELLTSDSTVKVNSVEYSPAGELRMLYNLITSLDKSSGDTYDKYLGITADVINAFANAHNKDTTNFIWKYILDAVIELDNSSETKGANASTNDVTYETYLSNKTFINRLKDILTPIYTNSRNNKDGIYLKYNDNVAYSNKDIDIIENRLKRANASFISQYQHRQNLRKYVNNTFKPVKIINVNNPSLNYLDNNESQSLYKSLNIKDNDTKKVSYIYVDNNSEKVTVLKSQNVDDENKQRLANNITLDAERGNTIRNLYLVLTHKNGNTSYAPAYTAKLSKVIDLDNGAIIKAKIDKYLKFIMTSIFNNRNTIANTSSSKTVNIRLSNGRIVSKDQILADLTHIISTGKVPGTNRSFFDFNATKDGLQIEYIADDKSYVINIEYSGNKPTSIAYSIKGTGFKKNPLPDNTTAEDLYNMIFKGNDASPGLLNNLTRSMPFNRVHNDFELSRIYYTIYTSAEYKTIKSKVPDAFIPVYELFENDIESATTYDNLFDYFVKTNAIVSNIDPILDNNNEILTYSSPDPTYKMSIIAQIDGHQLKSEKDLLSILESNYKEDIYKGVKDMIRHSKSFQGIDYIFDYNYIENGVMVNGNEAVIDILNKLKDVKFNTENDANNPRIMGFEKRNGVSSIIYNKANESKLNPFSFKSYLSHEIVHHILTDIRSKQRFEKSKDDIRNIYISLIKELNLQTPNYKQNIQNLLEYVFGSEYADIVKNIDNLTGAHIKIIDDILFKKERWQELVTYAYTDINYANMFNNMLYASIIEKLPINKNSSKLMGIIKKFFNTLLNVLGVNTTQGSYLKAIETIVFNSLGSDINNKRGSKGVTSIAQKQHTPSPVGMYESNSNDTVDNNNVSDNKSEALDWSDGDSSLDVIDLGDIQESKYMPTGGGVTVIQATLDSISKDNFVSLNIDNVISDLYTTTEVKNNIKIC